MTLTSVKLISEIWHKPSHWINLYFYHSVSLKGELASFSFETGKVSQLAQLDWSTASQLWRGNIVSIDPHPKNPAKPYKISAGVSPVRIAVSLAKGSLGWV